MVQEALKQSRPGIAFFKGTTLNRIMRAFLLEELKELKKIKVVKEQKKKGKKKEKTAGKK